jgi:hypothetical protein
VSGDILQLTPSGASEWVARDLNRQLLLSESMLVELLVCAFRTGPWNLGPWTSLRPYGYGATRTFHASRDLSTYDRDVLARLVILAHDACVRVEVSAELGKGGDDEEPHAVLRIAAHQRGARVGRMWDRHPTIEEAIAAVRPVRGAGHVT